MILPTSTEFKKGIENKRQQVIVDLSFVQQLAGGALQVYEARLITSHPMGSFTMKVIACGLSDYVSVICNL